MWGRPVDVLVMKDGSLLVLDDYNGIFPRQLQEVKCSRPARGGTATAAFAVALPLLLGVEAAAAALPVEAALRAGLDAGRIAALMEPLPLSAFAQTQVGNANKRKRYFLAAKPHHHGNVAKLPE